MTTIDHSRPDAATLTTGIRSETDAVAVSPHHLASEAALAVIRRGGNAVDGAIAANAVQGVVAPETCGVGGDLFALIHLPGEERPRALNASGRGGSGVTASMLRDRGHTEMPLRDPATITVPGCVDGWVALSKTHGLLPLAEAIAPAIELAENGFAVSGELGDALTRLADMIGGQPSAPPLYPEGRPAAAGTVIRRPMLADTLRAIATSGRESFYGGAPGAGITEATQGAVTAKDLTRDNADWVEPIGLDVFGLTGWTIPPNTQGYLALAAAWILEQLDPPGDPTDPAYVHAVIEAYRSIAWEREDLVADPQSAPLPPERLLDPGRLTPFVSAISTERAGTFPTPRPAPGGTAYMCVRDGAGMGVSLIQSNFWGIGSGLSAGATGVFLHNRGAGFNLVPGHPNELAPGKRPLHTLSPTLWTRGDQLAMLLGTRGGQFQPQILVQVVAALRRAGLAPAEAQRLPRWQVEGWRRDETPAVLLESRHEPAIVAGLEARGHAVRPSAPWEAGWGPVSIITSANAIVQGAADPRVSTSAAVTG